MLKKIKLLGHLGKKFGREYQFDVVSPAEAVRALCHQVKGFRQYMQDGNGRDQKFKILVGGAALDNPSETLHLQSNGDISIVPVVRGSGGDVVQIIVGTALVVAGFVTGNPYLIAAGAGLIIGGVITSTMKTPAVDAPSERDRNNDRSYLFNGAVNTTQQGQPIPIGYGRMRIGSQVVSASLSTTQVPV